MTNVVDINIVRTQRDQKLQAAFDDAAVRVVDQLIEDLFERLRENPRHAN
jgi:hypothetical protein